MMGKSLQLQLVEASGPILGCIGLIVVVVLVYAGLGWCLQRNDNP